MNFGFSDVSFELQNALRCAFEIGVYEETMKDRDNEIEAKGLEEVSLGDIVLSSGEPAALALIDACVRLLPGVMGNDQGVVNESFEGELLEHPHYTRPPMWEGIEVPQVLVSGNHKEIDIWRRQEAEIATRKRRPDMWERYNSLGSVRKLTNK